MAYLTHRSPPVDVWLPDNRASPMIVSDLAKQAATNPTPYPISISRGSSSRSTASSLSLIDSAYTSPSSTLESSVSARNCNVANSNTTTTTSKSWLTKQTRQQLDERISPKETKSCSRRHRPDTASLKEYGECYRRLGEGTTAVVMVVRKLGENGQAEKLYAIKQFRKRNKSESDKEYMKKLTSEFCISSTFSHPNVVETIDLVLDDRKRYCTVMEYCPGGDLFSCIMADRMTECEKACCFKQMMQGLAYLHSMGVAHRDIKPENLLLTQDGQVKITDFGVSDVFRYPWESQGHKSRGMVGSEPYIAPEAFEQKEYWGATADIWSAGVVLYCLWLGGLVWHRAKRTDQTFAKYLRAHPNQTFDSFRFFERDARRLLYKMLDPNPETRVSAEDILNDPWVKSIPVCERGLDASNRQHKHVHQRK
ncbi:serine/threonine-protein kinase HAL4/sat4 [Apophysomyces sp. BC1034]|nr:serine/threonine-protein kinase HAL4/sat4 [Apophysomyces sp. BC1015]KAG0182120.1 serine/threonine-protein kinase HAL4/sat4 [Apophysomyces sp. BC1021]KAG0186513.1 serine/threonine-protein kinase HAL4/sat4 [Apophysomyces sp. BC1034]